MTDEQFTEAMRLVDVEQARAAEEVRATLGPGPAERERELLQEAPHEGIEDPR